MKKMMLAAMAAGLFMGSTVSAYDAYRVYAGVGSNETKEFGTTWINTGYSLSADANYKSIDNNKKLYKAAIYEFMPLEVGHDPKSAVVSTNSILQGVAFGIGVVHSDIHNQAITKPSLNAMYEIKDWLLIKGYLADASNNGLDIEVPIYFKDGSGVTLAASYNEMQDVEQRNVLVKVYFGF